MNKFDKLFAKYEQTDEIRAILDDITSLTPRVDRDRRLIELEAGFSRIVPKVDLYKIEDGIREVYELNIVRILPKYDKSLFSKTYIPEAVKELNRVGAVSRGFFSQRSEDEIVLAVDALVQSLLELEEVSAVIIRFTDGETPEHGGIDMSGPITEITSQVIE